MKKAIVIMSLKVPVRRLLEFIRWNRAEIMEAEAGLLVVCDSKTARAMPDTDQDGFTAWPVTYPGMLPIFSITRTANYGIRCAMDLGYDVVIKSDVDVVFNGRLAALLEADNRRAAVPKYGDCASYAERDNPNRIMPDGQGTICLTALNWLRLQGYDERYAGWGADDNEMCTRIKEMGIAIDDSLIVAHIAHDATGKDWNSDSFNPKRWGQNRQLIPRSIGSQPEWGRVQERCDVE